MSDDDEAEDFDSEEPAAGKTDAQNAQTQTEEVMDQMVDPAFAADPWNRKYLKFKSQNLFPAKESAPTEYVAATFEGVDVRQWSEWDELMAFSKTGLAVVEVYSVCFGPADAMYPLIADAVTQEDVAFARLSLHHMSIMEVVHQAIRDHQQYHPSPNPLFLFIRNGKKVGQISGTKPAELATLIRQHLAERERAVAGAAAECTVP